jgi:hypothetical protein
MVRYGVVLGAWLVTMPLALANVVKDGGELAQACATFASHPEGYGKSPEGLRDPCRKFLEGYFLTLKDKNAADLKALTEPSASAPPAGPCVRMPDTLTYRDFASRIAAFGADNPVLRDGSPVALAQKTLEASFPCPEPEATR